MPTAALLTGLALVAFLVTVVRYDRRQQLQRIRDHWGRPERLRVRKMESILQSHLSRIRARPVDSLDDRTWTDLGLDDVFAALDRTESTLGQQALYHRLRSAPLGDHLDAFEALVRRFSTDVDARERAQLALSRLQDAHGYDVWWLAAPGTLRLPHGYLVFPLLTAALVGSVFVSLTLASPVPVLACVAINLAVRYSTFERLLPLVTAFRQLAPLVATAQSLRFLNSAGVGPIVAPLEAAPRFTTVKTIARWVGGDPLMLSKHSSFVLRVVSDFANVVYEYLDFVLLLDGNALLLGSRQLEALAPQLLAMVAASGDVDAAIAMASFRTGAGAWTTPRFLDRGASITLREMRHPLVDDAVANSIELAPPHGILVTGSNMSGKSTFLRTLGVNAILAQTVHTVLATEYAAPVFNVQSCISRNDDLLAGKSYYLVEVEALLALVKASGSDKPHLFLLDELFRGTNAVERIAAGEAVLRELVRAGRSDKPHIVIAATHDSELVDLLDDCYAPHHFEDSIESGRLSFTYRLKPGPSTTRNAIALLKLEGASDGLVRRALETAAMLEQQRRVPSA